MPSLDGDHGRAMGNSHAAGQSILAAIVPLILLLAFGSRQRTPHPGGAGVGAAFCSGTASGDERGAKNYGLRAHSKFLFGLSC